MASTNRDLTIGLISKMDRFDLKDAANQLEDLGDKAAKAGDETRQGMEKAEKAVKSVASGDEARKLDAFFDKMGDSAKKAGREVDDGMDKAGRGVDEFKDEARDSAREAAASFSGQFEDVGDLIQETLANGLGKLGPMGQAAGLLAAAGVGFFMSKIQEANERAKELRETFLSIRKEGIDPATDAMGHFVDTLDAEQLKFFSDEAKKLGIDGQVMKDALDGNAEAADALMAAIDKAKSRRSWWQDLFGAEDFDEVTRAVLENAQANKDAGDAADLSGEKQQKAAEAVLSAAESVNAYNVELQNLADAKHDANLEGIAGGLRDVADASGEVAAAVAEEGQVQIDALTDALNEATKAAKEHRTNVQTALKEGGEEFAAWVSEQGPEVSQAYAKGSAKERAALREAFKNNVGAQMGGGIGEGLDGSKQTVRDSAGNVYQVARDRLTGQAILIPVGVELQFSQATANRYRRQIERQIGSPTVQIRVGAGGTFRESSG